MTSTGTSTVAEVPSSAIAATPCVKPAVRFVDCDEQPAGVSFKKRTGFVSRFAGDDEFPMDETHGIALWPKHRLLADSRGLGWHDAYTSLATEAPWRRTLQRGPHYCIAYCTQSRRARSHV